MTGIESWSTTAGSNNAATPNGWPEGQAPSTVNDCARQMMASIRTWYQDVEWVPWGDTCTYVSGTSFKISGSDVTARYTVGRRVRAVGSSTGTIYGKITASSFSTDTTVTIVWDTGSLSNETLTVSLSAIKGSATGAVATSAHSVDIDATHVHGADVASASTANLDTATGDVVDITGTTNVTAITLAEGRERTVRFTGIAQISNGASLVLPGGADIYTEAGDYAIFRGYAAGVVRCVIYMRAIGIPQRTLSVQNSGSTNNSNSGSGADVNHDKTYTIPANWLTSGRAIRVTAAFKITTGSAAPTLIHKFKMGATTVAGHSAITPANNLANDNYLLQWILQATAAPGSSANTTTSIIVTTNSLGSLLNTNTTDQPVTLATNGTLAVTIATQWSAAGTGTNTVALDQFIVEALN